MNKQNSNSFITHLITAAGIFAALIFWSTHYSINVAECSLSSGLSNGMIESDKKLESILKEFVNKTGSLEGAIIIKSSASDKIKVASKNQKSGDKVCSKQEITALRSWEPGSIIKPLTILAVLNENNGSIPKNYPVKNQEILNGRRVLNFTVLPEKQYNIQEISAISINTGIVSMLKHLNKEESINARTREIWFDYLTKHYGFGRGTGTIKNERKGYVPKPSGLYQPDYRFSLMSVGLSFHATPLEIIQAYETALFNYEHTFHPQAAAQFKNILVGNMDYYELSTIPGYKAGGKTGISSIIDEQGRYTSKDTGVFIGFVETEESYYIALAKLVAPNTDRLASHEARLMWQAAINENIKKLLISSNDKDQRLIGL